MQEVGAAGKSGGSMVERLVGRSAKAKEEYWMSDSACNDCFACHAEFTFYFRRHHCRLCGRIFCGRCSSKVISGFLLGKPNVQPVRVCDDCYTSMEQRSSHGAAIPGANVTPQGTRPRGMTIEWEPDEGQVEGGRSEARSPSMQARSAHMSPDLSASKVPSAPPTPLKLAGADETGPGVEVAATSCPDGSTAGHLDEISRQRLTVLVGQLLHQEGIGEPAVQGGERMQWGQTLLRLAERAVETVHTRTQTHYDESIDFNAYVKVKKMPGGTVAECSYVDGVVTRRNVVHKKMRTEVERPKIMLLGGALEFQRREGSVQPMQQLLEQEEEYLKILVKKIRVLSPDVVLVEKSASRKVQMWLLNANISLVINVKAALLHRIARMTGGAVTLRTEELRSEASDTLGTCARWRVVRVPITSAVGRQKSVCYMYFEGCRAELGCTLLLRGAVSGPVPAGGVGTCVQGGMSAHSLTAMARTLRVDEAQIKSACKHPASLTKELQTLIEQDKWGLTRVKRLLLFAVFAAHSMLLEAAFTNNIGGRLTVDPESEPAPQDETHCEFVPCAKGEMLAVSPAYTFKVPGCLSMTEAYSRFFGVNWRTNHTDVQDRPHEDQVSVMRPDEALSVRHQRLLVLYHKPLNASSTAHRGGKRTDTPPPLEVKVIDYYKPDIDLTLGMYLLLNCFDPKYEPGVNPTGLQQHMRTYTHSRGRLTIRVIPLGTMPAVEGVEEHSEGGHAVLSWRSHRTTGHTTSARVMSAAALSLSFGKFLETFFYNESALCNETDTPLYRDHMLFFGYRSQAASFEYSPAAVHEVLLPAAAFQKGANRELQVMEWKEEVDNFIFATEWMYGKSRILLRELMVQEPSDSIRRDLQNMLSVMDVEETKILAELQALPAQVQRLQAGDGTLDTVLQLTNFKWTIQQREGWFRQSISKIFRLDTLSTTSARRSKIRDTGISVARESSVIRALTLDGQGQVGSTVIDPTKGELHPDLERMLQCAQKQEWTFLEQLAARRSRSQVHGDVEQTGNAPSPVGKLDGNVIPEGQELGLLHLLALSGQVTLMWRLHYEHGLDFDVMSLSREPMHARTAMDIATKRGDAAMVDLLAYINRADRSLPLPASLQAAILAEQQLADSPPAILLEPQHLAEPPIVAAEGGVADQAGGDKYATSVADASLSSSKVIETEAKDSPSPAIEVKMPVLGEDDIGYVSELAMRAARCGSDGLLSMLVALTQMRELKIPDPVIRFFQSPAGVNCSKDYGGPDELTPTVFASKEAGLEEPSSLIAHALASEAYRQHIDSFASDRETLLTSSDNTDWTMNASGVDVAGQRLKFRITVYCAAQFAALRCQYCDGGAKDGRNEAFIVSLMRCKRVSTKLLGGRERSSGPGTGFHQTLDERYIIKYINDEELDGFLTPSSKTRAPWLDYFEHMSQVLFAQQFSCLVKLLGIYQLEIVGRKSEYVIVMENLFWGKDVSKIYDLKGVYAVHLNCHFCLC